jgi:hypothetical protein
LAGANQHFLDELPVIQHGIGADLAGVLPVRPAAPIAAIEGDGIMPDPVTIAVCTMVAKVAMAVAAYFIWKRAALRAKKNPGYEPGLDH